MHAEGNKIRMTLGFFFFFLSTLISFLRYSHKYFAVAFLAVIHLTARECFTAWIVY